jgi:serine/threonine-protein kinase mTOR
MDADILLTEFIAQNPTVTPGGPRSSRSRARTSSTVAPEAGQDAAEIQNERAVQVLNRVKEKLTGRDFKPDEELTIIQQVDKLLVEATKLENLCQHYIGWCSFW